MQIICWRIYLCKNKYDKNILVNVLYEILFRKWFHKVVSILLRWFQLLYDLLNDVSLYLLFHPLYTIITTYFDGQPSSGTMRYAFCKGNSQMKSFFNANVSKTEIHLITITEFVTSSIIIFLARHQRTERWLCKQRLETKRMKQWNNGNRLLRPWSKLNAGSVLFDC